MTLNARAHEPPTHRLSGSLGPGAVVFMVVAAAAPLTVIAGTVPLGISAGNGAAYPASYIVCTVVLLFFAVGFTAMAKHVPGAGRSTPSSPTDSAGTSDWVPRSWRCCPTPRCRVPSTDTSARPSATS